MRMRQGVIIFTLGVAFVAGGITAPATHATAAPAVRYGAWVQQGSAPTHLDAVRALEAQLGYRLAIDNHYRPWTNTFWRDEQDDIASGREPMISWTAQGTTAAAIASGSQDATIARVADAVKALRGRVLVRFAYEMDQPKGRPRYLGPPAQFIAAWRHVYTLFDARGATNARFVWAPIAANYATGVAQSFYPGNRYVDWIGADGYNWYPGRPGSKWTSFGQIFAAFDAWAAPRGKPLMVAETGVQEDPADPARKAAWFADEATWLGSHPAIRAVCYFDGVSPKGYDFRADTSTTSFSAFQALGLKYGG
jgi:Glycosyl hydrolase family 26